MGEWWTGTPRTKRRPCVTVRPMAGKAGHTRAPRARAPSTSASSSAATGPRKVESIFLKTALRARRGPSVALSRRTAAVASASESARIAGTRQVVRYDRDVHGFPVTYHKGVRARGAADRHVYSMAMWRLLRLLAM